MELNQEKIEQGIISGAVDELVNGEHLIGLVQKEVRNKIDEIFVKVANEQISREINKAIEDGFSREYVKRNSWGEAAGAPTTISKELERLIGGYWNQMVDKQGKPSDSSYGNVTRAEYLMTTIAAKDFEEHMKQQVVNVAGKLKDSLRATLNENLNKLVSEVFHVQSIDDQALKTGGKLSGRSLIDPLQT